LVDFFFGDSFVFFGDFGEFVDLVFFGDSRVFFGDLVVDLVVDFALAALAFFGDVANFFGLVVVFFEGEDFFVGVFLGDLAVVDVDVDFLVGDFVLGGDFFGDLTAVEVFLELDVDLFLGDEGAVVEDPEVAWVVEVEEVEDFFEVDFFFLSLVCDPGASLYDAFTFTNKVPSLR